MKISIYALALLAFCSLVQRADASVLGQLVEFGSLNLADDESVGILRDTSGDGVPDLIQGVVWLNSVGPVNNAQNVATATGSSLFAVYSFDLTPKTFGAQGGFTGAAATGAGTTIADLLSGADFSQLNPVAALNPAIAIISVAGSFTHTDWANTGGAGTMALDFLPGNLSDFTVELTLGLTGDDNHTIRLADPTDPTNPTGNFRGVYSVASQIFASGVLFDNIPGSSAGFGGYFPGGNGQVIINDGTTNYANPGDAGRGWDFVDGGTYFFQPTPEPMSLVVWGGMLAVAGVAMRRRLMA